MKIVLERHAYAPELNCAYLGKAGTRIPAPGCTSIKDVRTQLFRPLAARGRHVTLSTHYPATHAWLNRRHSGMCNDLALIVSSIKQLRDRLAPGLGAFVKVNVRMLG
jgi:hypothetical protein